MFTSWNHDKWFAYVLHKGLTYFREEYLVSTEHANWYHQDGRSTYDSYRSQSDEAIYQHKTAFYDRLRYYHVEGNTLFVHGGFHVDQGFEEIIRTNQEQMLWDRSLYRADVEHWQINNNLRLIGKSTKDRRFGRFETIYIGHTPTVLDGFTQPTKMANVINVDQGCKCWAY